MTSAEFVEGNVLRCTFCIECLDIHAKFSLYYMISLKPICGSLLYAAQDIHSM